LGEEFNSFHPTFKGKNKGFGTIFKWSKRVRLPENGHVRIMR